MSEPAPNRSGRRATRGGRGRWLAYIGAGLAIGLVVFWMARTGRMSRYPFVHRLGGEESIFEEITGQVPESDTKICYTFTSDSSEVRRAILDEFKGWVKAIDDAEYLVLRETSERAAPTIIFRRLRDKASGGVTCYAVVPRDRTVVETAMNWLQMRIGRKEKAKVVHPAAVIFSNSNWTIMKQPDGVQATFTWRNFSDDPLEVRLDTFFYGGYESLEPLPFRASLGPGTSTTNTLTFPKASHNARSYDIVVLRSQSGIAGTSSMTSGGVSVDPQASLVGSTPSSHTFILESPRKDRDIEVRNVAVEISGRSVATVKGAFVLRTGMRRRVPVERIAITAANRSMIELKGEARLLPNKRWRAFSIKP